MQANYTRTYYIKGPIIIHVVCGKDWLMPLILVPFTTGVYKKSHETLGLIYLYISSQTVRTTRQYNVLHLILVNKPLVA